MNERAVLQAALARARLQRDLACQQVEALEAAFGGLRQPEVSEPERPEDLVAPCVAATRFGVDESTIRRWARAGGLGERCGGRWLISINKVGQRASASLRPPR